MNLTNEQNIALKRIISFLENDSEEIFILKGYAGTGKTFLIKAIVEYLNSADRNFLLAAPTGRAARILEEKTGYKTFTIHSLIYSLSEHDMGDSETNNEVVWKFNIKNNDDDISTVYIIDEASMISDAENGNEEFLRFGSGKLLSDLFNYIGYLSDVKIPELNRKTIFIGDYAQLPPITSTFSPALNTDFLKREYNLKGNEYNLTKVIRQNENSGILENATNIRKGIEEKKFNKLLITENKDVTVIDNPYQEEENNNEDKILITYSNKTALDYNLIIHNKLFNQNDIAEGDKLIVVANNYKHHLMNGDIVKIVSIDNEKESYPVFLKGRDKKIELHFRKITIKTIPELENNSTQEVFILENLLHTHNKSLSREELVALRVLSAQKMNIKFPTLKLKKENPVKYNVQKKNYIKKMKESKYYNALHVKFGYAITCHKAQGGEWKNVYVDFSWNGSITNQNYFRWVYTAITRAKEKLFVINPPKITPWNNILLGVDNIDDNNEFDSAIQDKVNDEDIIIPESIKEGLPENLYLEIGKIVKNIGVTTEKVLSMNWRERYFFIKNEDVCVIDFIYNKKGKITKSVTNYSDEDLKDNLLSKFNDLTLISTNSGKKKNTFPKLFLKEFFEILEKNFKKTGVDITVIEHRQFAEYYEFKKEKDFCELLFYYKGQDVFSNKPPVIIKTNNNAFAKYCIRKTGEFLKDE